MRTRRPPRVASLAFCTALLAAPHAHAGARAIWALSDGDKVAIDERTHALRARNEVWDGRGLRLLAARNEIVAFQVVVEADDKGLSAVSVSLPWLARGESRIAYAPLTTDPSLSVGRPIQLFSVRSMKVTEESHAEWVWKPGSPAAPRKTVGFQPVQLVPENARAGRGGFPAPARRARRAGLLGRDRHGPRTPRRGLHGERARGGRRPDP